MTIAEAKGISIVVFLANEGYHPVRRYGNRCLYLSPLRSERHASFLVECDKNIWHDNGTDNWGDVVELAAQLWKTSVSEVLKRLDSNQYGNVSIQKTLSHTKVKRHADMLERMHNVSVIPLKHPALLSYLQSRHIDLEIGRQYCREIHYTLDHKRYFSIAFQNSDGDYEVRNPYFKGCFGKKTITLLPLVSRQRQEGCIVFEGFMDFLAYLTLLKRGDPLFFIEEPCDYLVMNSVNNLKVCLVELECYRHIHCFLDNDEAGQRTTDIISQCCEYRVTNETFRYAEYKDVNDYLIGRKR